MSKNSNSSFHIQFSFWVQISGTPINLQIHSLEDDNISYLAIDNTESL